MHALFPKNGISSCKEVFHFPNICMNHFPVNFLNFNFQAFTVQWFKGWIFTLQISCHKICILKMIIKYFLTYIFCKYYYHNIFTCKNSSPVEAKLFSLIEKFRFMFSNWNKTQRSQTLIIRNSRHEWVQIRVRKCISNHFLVPPFAVLTFTRSNEGFRFGDCVVLHRSI